MVNALARTASETIVKDENKLFRSIELFPLGDEKIPCALREFINSNADLPTIDELAKRSKSLAMAMGLVY